MWEFLAEILIALIDVCLQPMQRDRATADDRRAGIGCILILLAIVAVICLIVFFSRD